MVNNTSEINIHRNVESKPKAINIPCLKKKSLVLAAWTYKLVKITENWLLWILSWNFYWIFYTSGKKLEKKKQVIWIKGKNNKNHTSWQENEYTDKKKGEREVCLLFWLKIYSIIENFNWKLVWRQVPKLEVCWVFFIVFLLYSRAILSFSLSPSLLLCPFHCFNCWIILEKLS